MQEIWRHVMAYLVQHQLPTVHITIDMPKGFIVQYRDGRGALCEISCWYSSGREPDARYYYARDEVSRPNLTQKAIIHDLSSSLLVPLLQPTFSTPALG